MPKPISKVNQQVEIRLASRCKKSSIEKVYAKYEKYLDALTKFNIIAHEIYNDRGEKVIRLHSLVPLKDLNKTNLPKELEGYKVKLYYKILPLRKLM